MKYLIIDPEGGTETVDTLDDDRLASFDGQECEIYRFENGRFEVPIIEGDGEDTPFNVVRWTPLL